VNHRIISYIYMYINALAKNFVLQLYLWHDFYNTIFKVKHKLYIAPGCWPWPYILWVTIGCLKNDYTTPTVNNIYSSSACTVSDLVCIQLCAWRKRLRLHVQTASFYSLPGWCILVWLVRINCTVIGPNKL